MAEYIQIPTPAGNFDALTAGPADGRPVMLLHGFPQAAVEWSEQLSVLGGAECCAVAPDQRGYSPGVRPDNVADYKMQELVGDVLAIADQLGWQRFDLVGHDWGAAVAWSTAAAHPDRVRTLTAVSIPHVDAFGKVLREDEDQQQRSAYMQALRASTAEKTLLEDGARKLRGIYRPGGVPDHHVDDYVQRLTEPGALTAALNWYRAMRSGERVEPVDVPTTYVWSSGDIAIGRTAAEACGGYVTGDYRFVELPGSHWVPEQSPEELAAAVLDRIASS